MWCLQGTKVYTLQVEVGVFRMRFDVLIYLKLTTWSTSSLRLGPANLILALPNSSSSLFYPFPSYVTYFHCIHPSSISLTSLRYCIWFECFWIVSLRAWTRHACDAGCRPLMKQWWHLRIASSFLTEHLSWSTCQEWTRNTMHSSYGHFQESESHQAYSTSYSMPVVQRKDVCPTLEL